MNCVPSLKSVLPLLLFLMLWNIPARAGALLKPTGSGATQNLRARELKIEAEIDGAFSRTTITTVYANPNNRQIEADFIYTAPEHATVTGFAYWFKGEKVIARVVEKERASEIYNLITWSKRDPAIVEMIGKNTFRARIFPVEARADLQVEVQFIEPLSATRDGWQWSYPLAEESKNYPLEKVRLESKIENGREATVNFGAFKNGVLNEEKTNVQNAADIRIEIPAPRAPLRASLFAARDGGEDGFFAIALVPDFSASNPHFAVSGVKTYEVMGDDTARAGKTFVALGRYRGSGEALVKLGARSVRVNFPDRRVPGNIAALMWGSRRIETLSSSEHNRAAVMNLSKRFNIPSKWTSWLALPASEKKAFESSLIEFEMKRAVRNWAQAVATGNSEKEKIFRSRAYNYDARLAKVTGRNLALTDRVFRDELDAELDRVIKAYWAKNESKVTLARYGRNLRARGAKSGIERESREQRERGAREKRKQAIYERAEKKNRERLNALESGQKTRASNLNREIDAMLKNVELGGYDPREGWTGQRLNEIATAIWQERKAGVKDSPRQQELLRKLRVLLPTTGQSERQVLEQARSVAYAPDLQKSYVELTDEINAGQEESARAGELRSRIEQLQPLVSSYSLNSESWQLNDSYRRLAAKLAADYARKVDEGASPEEAEPLKERARRNFERIETNYKGEFGDLLAQGWRSIINETANTIAEEIVAGRENSPALQKAQIRLKRASDLGGRDSYSSYAISRAWQGRAHETAYRLIQARKKGDTKEVSQLEKQLQIEVEKADKTPLDAYLEWEKNRIKRGEPLITAADYRLRPGDPLISVRAPADCQKVVAILPSGELLPLVFDPQKGAWEARFDVPGYASEGEYKVVIILVDANGMRRQLTMFFNVDMTAPTGKGEVHFEKDTFDLRLTSDENTDRVTAFLPWNERVELRRDESGVFGAQAAVPTAWQNRAARVRFVVTDKAHNRTELEVDWAENTSDK